MEQGENTRAKEDGLAGILASVLETNLTNRAGALADYIPELSRVEPESFGIAIATMAGTGTNRRSPGKKSAARTSH